MYMTSSILSMVIFLSNANVDVFPSTTYGNNTSSEIKSEATNRLTVLATNAANISGTWTPAWEHPFVIFDIISLISSISS